VIRILNIIVFVLNVALVAALLLSYASVYINPDVFYIPAFFGLAYPFILLGNILVIIWWIFRLNLKFLMSLGVIITGWSFVGRTFQVNKKISADPKALKVISYNVMIFGLEKNQNSRDDILNLVADEQPDILCVQEFFNSSNWTVNMEKKIGELLHTKYRFFHNVGENGKNYKVGTIIYSKYPIKGSGVVPYNMETSNSTIYIDIDVNGIAVRVFNVHLQSIKFQRADYEFLKTIGDNREQTIKESKSIIARMRDAYVLRASQAKLVQEAIKQSPGKVIVCGDFNDAPVSYVYGKISDGLKDAFVESGTGLGRSYAGKFPSFRIDYIFGSQSFDMHGFEVIDKKYSDHYPIKALITVK
jgi:endonuclease/exonuclease/phosphatase family metal-dependent hydrolase